MLVCTTSPELLPSCNQTIHLLLGMQGVNGNPEAGFGNRWEKPNTVVLQVVCQRASLISGGKITGTTLVSQVRENHVSQAIASTDFS